MSTAGVEQFDVLIRPLVSEKGHKETDEGKYRFAVRPEATKTQIKKAVEKAFKVTVLSVNVMVQPGKKRRVRWRVGHTPEWKKAIVTLKEGDHIQFFERM